MARRIFARQEPFTRKLVQIFLRLSVVLLLWGGGLIWFFVNLPPVSSEAAMAKTDALVVLTGGKGRLEEGFRLLKEGNSEKLFISGVYQGVEVSALLKMSNQSDPALTCCTSLGYEAHNTAGNAKETASWIQEHRYTSLKLITAHYHMPRALLEFEMALPAVDIIAYPIMPPSFTIKGWWKGQGRLFLVIGEYHKYLVTFVKYGWSRLL